MKINKNNLVLVGMVESSHFKNWLKVLIDLELFHKIWIIPSDYPVKKLTTFSLGSNSKSSTKIRVFNFPFGWKLNNLTFRLLDLIFSLKWRSIPLYIFIKIVRPNYIHFHELQHGAYIYNHIYRLFNKKRKFKIISSTWGSDLLFYGRLESHKRELEKVLAWTDTLTSERIDDLEVAKSLGFSQKFFAPVYITVGAKLPIKEPKIAPSKRSEIIIKGYQDSHGRALNALAALELIHSHLKKFKIRIFSASLPVKLQIEFLKSKYGLDIAEIPRISNQELQNHFANSRLYIGLAVSDGLSTSMIEAMKNGTFAIQSSNSSANIFLVDGITGFISDPWDIESIANKILIALTTDDLVDKAVSTNFSKLESFYDFDTGVNIINDLYRI